MSTLTMVYWRGNKFWLGKLLEHPEIMTQGETIEELEENMIFISIQPPEKSSLFLAILKSMNV